MKKEDLKDLLNKDEINISAIAEKMYPNNTKQAARSRLSNKLNENAGQRFTHEDLIKGNEVFKNLADDIYSRIDL